MEFERHDIAHLLTLLETSEKESTDAGVEKPILSFKKQKKIAYSLNLNIQVINYSERTDS